VYCVLCAGPVEQLSGMSTNAELLAEIAALEEQAKAATFTNFSGASTQSLRVEFQQREDKKPCPSPLSSPANAKERARALHRAGDNCRLVVRIWTVARISREFSHGLFLQRLHSRATSRWQAGVGPLGVAYIRQLATAAARRRH
jgi:hypothetical protein